MSCLLIYDMPATCSALHGHARGGRKQRSSTMTDFVTDVRTYTSATNV
jgi:hypothetical protein